MKIICFSDKMHIFQSRYPIIVKQFGLNHGSGGVGQFHGGNGVIRELQFRRPLSLSILSERRKYPPYGLFGMVLLHVL